MQIMEPTYILHILRSVLVPGEKQAMQKSGTVLGPQLALLVESEFTKKIN